MRKQELKSRKKAHARKRAKNKQREDLQQKEITIVRYEPEVMTIEEMKKRIR